MFYLCRVLEKKLEFFFLKNNANVENCESFRGFINIYIYIYREREREREREIIAQITH